MAINSYICHVSRIKGGIALRAHRDDPPTDGHIETYLIRGATVGPMPGDFMHFGSAGTLQPDGTYLGGGGFIAMDGNEFPYIRISSSELIQGW